MIIKAIEDKGILNCKNCDLFKRDCDLYDEAVKQTGKDCCDVVNYENAIAYAI